MRRFALILAVLAVGALAAGIAYAQRPPLFAKVTSCTTGFDPTDRAAVFTGSMPAIAGARRMWMRFDLYQRKAGTGAQGWRHVSLPKFGVWQKSHRGVPGFIYDKRVQGLTAPASYRAVVRFRWYSASGRLVRSRRRTTGVCKQPDPRPNLTVDRIGVGKADASGQAKYTVVVRNSGLGPDASPFGVVLTIDGVDQPGQTAGPLGAHEKTELTFTAPRCAPSGSVRVTLDPGGAVSEASEADNVATRPCPGGSGA